MRPGRLEDLPGAIALWRAEAREGRRDSTPGDSTVQRMAGLDLGACSRVIDAPEGGLEGMILVIVLSTPEGTVARRTCAGAGARPAVRAHLLDWGLKFSKAMGAAHIQLYCGPGGGDGLADLGLKVARRWWRMDRAFAGGLPEPVAVPGYELQDADRYPAGGWSKVYNLAFADHWRFLPYSEEALMAGRRAELCLMAVRPSGSPAALALSEIETYTDDRRPQPVGVVVVVATLPAYRRKGLAGWLVAESLRRLEVAGARHASLYVDGDSQTRAYDVYRKLGFDVAFEYEVWEASFS